MTNAETHHVDELPNQEKAYWHCHTLLEKFDEHGELYEVVEVEGNHLLLGGASAFFNRLIGGSVPAFSNSTARLGVGDSTTAAAGTQNDLVGTNKIRKGMESDYPVHTDASGGSATTAAAQCAFRSVFGPTEANFVWNEWGIFNGANTSDRMLNRRVEAMGTKVANTTWQLTVTVSLATA